MTRKNKAYIIIAAVSIMLTILAVLLGLFREALAVVFLGIACIKLIYFIQYTKQRRTGTK